MSAYDKQWIKETIRGKITRYFGCRLEEATPAQQYEAVAMTVRDQIMELWSQSREEKQRNRAKRLYYLSVEFLIGRSLHCNMINLVKKGEYESAMRELGIELDEIEECENDPGLGNGGLGRLAACFMDSLATLSLPATGCSIRYEYGLFRQRIVDGYQIELPDNWLDNGSIWEVQVREDAQQVRFGGHIEEEEIDGVKVIRHVDARTILAVPYDVPVVGYNGSLVNVLRLWSARAVSNIDMTRFNRGDYLRAAEEKEMAEVISKVLYPEDNHMEGRELRLRQQYFFTSATIQYMMKEFKRQFGLNFDRLPQQVAVHVNDTHPALAIPEMIRILVDEENLSMEKAVALTRACFAYTNHTVMAEALERWPEELIRTQLPRIHQILHALNEMWCAELWQAYAGQWDRIAAMAVISYGQVHMANLCCAFGHMVNGVSGLHAQILKHDTFRDFYVIEPDKFIGITNGITHRRWLIKSNPGLTALINGAIGDGWIDEPDKLADLLPFRDDGAFCERFAAVKHANKIRFSNWLSHHQGVLINPDAIFDVQAKRLHEYKRQLLNILHVISLYQQLEADPSLYMQPHTFLFAAKAAPGYGRAKLIIKLINSVAQMVAAHPRISQTLQVVFVENYGVTAAERMMPAADVSEQISTAGKEASGTGNMKFMMNGALTIGTLDGANVEMLEKVGPENFYLFGLKAAEVEAHYRDGDYRAGEIYETQPTVQRVLDALVDGPLTQGQTRLFSELYHALLHGDGGLADPYFVLKDFDSYAEAHRQIDRDYRDPARWFPMAVANTAASGYFSSDRTIAEYNDRIWHLPKLTLPGREMK